MEFKAQEKWRVQQNFSITEKQLDVAIKRMENRHPLESWVSKKVANNGDEVVYLKLEFVEWLKDVYFNRNIFYLDAEICFFEKQINRLEKELNIPHRDFNNQAMTVREACLYFDKCVNTIYSGLTRMRKNNIHTVNLKDGKVLIPAEGIKWLSKNYFRSSYLKNIELYKLELQKQKGKFMKNQNNDNKKLRRQKINVMLNEEERNLITEKAIGYGYGDCLAEYIRAACIYENIFVEDVEGKNKVCATVSKYIEVIREIINEQKKLLKNPIVPPQDIKKIIDQNKRIVENIDSLQKTLVAILSVNMEEKIQHRTKMIDTHRTDAKILKRVTEYDKKITILRPSNLKKPVKEIKYVVFLKMYEYSFNLSDIKAEDFVGLVNLFRDVAMKKSLLICFYKLDNILKFGIVMTFDNFEEAEKYALQENQNLYGVIIENMGLVGDIYSSNS